jgi:hypothetical protein
VASNYSTEIAGMQARVATLEAKLMSQMVEEMQKV